MHCNLEWQQISGCLGMRVGEDWNTNKLEKTQENANIGYLNCGDDFTCVCGVCVLYIYMSTLIKMYTIIIAVMLIILQCSYFLKPIGKLFDFILSVHPILNFAKWGL